MIFKCASTLSKNSCNRYVITNHMKQQQQQQQIIYIHPFLVIIIITIMSLNIAVVVFFCGKKKLNKYRINKQRQK